MTESHDKMRLELRRGLLAMAAMAALRQEHYGYSLRRELSESGLEIDEGTLYPLIRRMEDQGMLTSEWRKTDGRDRRYYRLSPAGGRVLAALESEWRQLTRTLELILGQQR
mgnify:CR=1 FL=1